MRKLLALLIVLFSIFSICSAGIVFAAIDFRNVDIAKSYGPGQLFEGSFDLELEEESADSALEVIFKNKIELTQTMPILDFLEANEANFSCFPEDCEAVYTADNPGSVKTVGKEPREKYIGLVIEEGTLERIDSLSFNITGKGGGVASCGIPPVMVDLGDDGKIDWQYTEPSGWCDAIASETYDESAASPILEIGSVPYCEKIKIIKSGRFKLSTDMVKGSVGELVMSINDFETGDYAECSLIPGNGIASCEVNFTVAEEKEYYVCVAALGESNHKIKAETQFPGCGKAGLEEFECSESKIDYAIFATPARFKVFNGTSVFNAQVFEEFAFEDLSIYLQDYIDRKYAGNCSSECIIPIKIISTQDVEFSDLTFRYSIVDLGLFRKNEFYSLEREAAEIDLDRKEMQLSKAGFSVPFIYDEYGLEIWIGEEKIEDDVIKVEQVPVITSVKPLVSLGATLTKFSAFASSPKGNEIVLYEWDFGDGEVETTTEPFVEHIYSYLGTFTLTLEVEDNESLKARKSFDIVTIEPKEAVNASLTKKKGNLEKIKAALAALPVWYKESAAKQLDLEKISADLEIFEEDSKKPDANYVSIKSALDAFVVPTGIEDEEIGLAPIIPTVNIEYLDYVSMLGEKIESGEEEDIREKIEEWNSWLEIKTSSTVKVALADTKEEDNMALVTVIKIILNAKEKLEDVHFIFLPEAEYEEVKFKENYSAYSMQEIDGGIDFFFSKLEIGETKEIELALPGRRDPMQLKMFGFPPLIKLIAPEIYCGNGICEEEVGENYVNCPEDCRKPIGKVVIWSLIVLILLAAGLFVIWKYYAAYYDRKLREKIFKTKEDFFKLTFFIANEINKGKKEEEIRSELVKAGWSAEQIYYGIKKVKEQTKKIQRQSILAYVTKELKAGKKESELKTELEKAGWSDKLIKYGMKKAGKKAEEIRKK